MAPPAAPSRASALLLDIEGTTTSITFVKDVLFPYATENVEKYLESSWEDQNVQDTIEGMRQQASKDVDAKIEGAVPIPDKDSPKADLIEAVSKSLKWLISIDNKNTHMKQLSGFIWQKGYEEGKLKGHVYEDVEPAFKLWKNAGLKIYIYSSGSVNAQKLLMKYSTAGDLQPHIDDYFDTNVGHKREIPSYKKILEKISAIPDETIFFTDIAEEANAANEAGINIVLMSRDGNAPLSSEAKEKFYVAENFSGLEISSTSAKRKQQAEDESMPPAKIAKVEEKETEKSSDSATATTTVNNDTAMEVDIEPMKEVLKDETEKKIEIVESKEKEKPTETAIVEEQKSDDSKVSVPPVEEKTEMEVDNVEENKKHDTEINSELDRAVEEKLVETDVKLEESNKTDDIIVSDKDQVPLKTETEKKNDSNDTTEAAEVKPEVANEKTEQNGIAETKNENTPEEKDTPKEEKMEVAENIAKPIDVCEEKQSEILPENPEKTNDKEVVAPATVTEEASDIDMIVNNENIATETAAAAAIINSEDIDDEKLNKLLSEEGAALEKECEEILSKVEQVTNIDMIATKDNNEESDSPVETEISNGHKTIVDELVSTVTSNVLDEILPELPITEAIDSTILEADKVIPIENVNDINVKELEKSPESSNVNDNHSESNGDKESNGTSDINGESAKANGNGKTIEDKCEVNGQNSEHTNDKSNGTSIKTTDSSEALVDQSDIKVKKLPAEETPVEKKNELVET